VFIKLNRRRGQSTLEYAILISVVIAALLAMAAYLKRGLQGKYKESADDIGEAFSPGQTTGSITVTTDYSGAETNKAGVQTTTISKDQTKRTGKMSVAAEASEYWPK